MKRPSAEGFTANHPLPDNHGQDTVVPKALLRLHYYAHKAHIPPYMPLRPLNCRRAVAAFQQPSPHVWITDEQLSSAFNRFLRVSTYTSRRYGSNVPGPLEARKRLAKRRINGLTPVACSGAGGGSFDPSLFASSPDFEGGCRWQPPTSAAPDHHDRGISA